MAKKARSKKQSKAKAPARVHDGLVGRRELAHRLGVNAQTITKWHDEGLPIEKRGRKGVENRYDLDEVEAWRKKRDAEKAAATSTPTGLNAFQAKAEKEHWQGRLAQQQYLLRSGELVRTVDVEKMWAAEVTAVRAIILASYVTHADRICRAAKLDGLAGVEREMKALGEEICRELAREDRPVAELDDVETESAAPDVAESEAAHP
jgi:phage terminase Nu1 subunit (DNA packaging protein)